MIPFIGELSALLAAISWAATSMIYESVTPTIGSVNTNVFRMLTGVVLFVLTILVFQLPVDLSTAQVRNLIVSSLLGLVLGDSFLFKAFQQIGARISMLVMTTAPAIAALLAFLFLGETLSLWGIGGMLLTLSGIAFVLLDRTAPATARHRITKMGLMYALLGAIGQGSGVLFAKMAFNEGEIHGIVAACIRLGVAMLMLWPVAAMSRHYRGPVAIFKLDKKIFGLLMIGTVSGIYVGLTLSLVAISYAKVGIASTLIASSPVLMLPLVRIVHKEILSWKAITGACVAVAGVAILFLR